MKIDFNCKNYQNGCHFQWKGNFKAYKNKYTVSRYLIGP